VHINDTLTDNTLPKYSKLINGDLGWKDLGFYGSQYDENTLKFGFLAQREMVFYNAMPAAAKLRTEQGSMPFPTQYTPGMEFLL